MNSKSLSITLALALTVFLASDVFAGINGSVTHLSGGGGLTIAGTSGSVGKKFKAGDTISTGSGQYAQILLADGSIVVLAPNTTISFSEIPGGGTMLNQISGRIRVKVSCKAGKFQVNTGKLVIDYTKCAETDSTLDHVDVIDGKVKVNTPNGASQEVQGGNSVQVDGDGNIQPTNALPPGGPTINTTPNSGGGGQSGTGGGGPRPGLTGSTSNNFTTASDVQTQDNPVSEPAPPMPMDPSFGLQR